jgi:hypothetical protein
MNESRLSTNTLRVHKLLWLQTGNVLQHTVALRLLQELEISNKHQASPRDVHHVLLSTEFIPQGGAECDAASSARREALALHMQLQSPRSYSLPPDLLGSQRRACGNFVAAAPSCPSLTVPTCHSCTSAWRCHLESTCSAIPQPESH